MKIFKKTAFIPFVLFSVLLYGCNPNTSSNSNNGSQSDSVEASQILTVTEKDWKKGGGFGTAVTLIEYADFQCPACASYAPLIKELQKDYPSQLQIVFRHFPLSGHKNAFAAAKAAEAAGKDKKFFEMHDLLFQHQSEWADLADPTSTFASYAEKIGLNKETFLKNFQDPSIEQNIQTSLQNGRKIGVRSTPSFYMNGMKISNPRSYEEFKQIIEIGIKNPSLGQKDTTSQNNSADAPENENDDVTTSQPEISQESGEVHEHADFAVYINNTRIDFSDPKYQSTEEKHLHEYTHLHDGNDNVIHKHKKGVTLGDLFTSLGMEFTKDCFTTKDYALGRASCNLSQEEAQMENPSLPKSPYTLKFYVNGKPNDQFDTYEIQDLDRILISYGPENDPNLQRQLDSLTDEACIYSEKCPERGKPPVESCVGGLGSGCEE